MGAGEFPEGFRDLGAVLEAEDLHHMCEGDLALAQVGGFLKLVEGGDRREEGLEIHEAGLEDVEGHAQVPIHFGHLFGNKLLGLVVDQSEECVLNILFLFN